ncbi:MAG TPA: SDR family oxidoreductase [Rectinemataceae bacterium]|nr:SDR family oxidoreductase [Rectinemataceae bacterium]
MRVLLTGASGLLGRAISARLRGRRDIELSGTAFSRARAPLIKADLTNSAEVAALFASTKPDFVIHAAAERRPDIVDGNPGQARALNVAATEMVARACAQSGAYLLYISTDYVFDGSNPPYFPDSPVNPLNEYGKLKLEGEARVAAAMAEKAQGAAADTGSGAAAGSGDGTGAMTRVAAKAAILRIPILYGPVEKLEESPVTELAALLKKGEPCAVDDWASRYPLHVDDAAAGIETIMDAAMRRPGGLAAAPRRGLPVFLLSSPVAFTKYGMIAAIAKALGVDASFVHPDASPPKGAARLLGATLLKVAPRPKDCRMDTTAIEALGYKPRIEFEQGIADALAPFFQG